MIWCITYSDEHYADAKRLHVYSAKKYGGGDKIIPYGPEDIDNDFYEANKSILNERKGNGYWLWKPYFIKKTLEKMSDNDYVCYSDAGVVYVNRVDYLVEFMKKHGLDILCFEMGLIESHYTKRDTFVLTDCDSPEYSNSKQRIGVLCVFRKCEKSCSFVDEWLKCGCDRRAITDDDNQLGLPNYEGFVAHRHDQSIFSLLTKKYGIQAYRDPSQFGNGRTHSEMDYPQIFFIHRNGHLKNWNSFKLYKFHCELHRKNKLYRSMYGLVGKLYRVYDKTRSRLMAHH